MAQDEQPERSPDVSIDATRSSALHPDTVVIAGSHSQTLITALYYDAFAADTRPTQAMDAMTMLYISTTPVLLVIALRFISPTQMVYRPQT